ncbi:transmembrane protein 268-like [Carassius auratus]|uniref:Transmembrane protein 268-like n=1 Tax=Carassius auratus TaxID=7957 RepID=A0A6P6RI41_CARAU|nr:transmembrane protein 268-like [Carassius auratus]XP_026144833.1 transmembrane protein 268-like [Carassius auratus]XP_026144834.1 transmembrane protein 268-like [Carassius auratus]XP_026144836.1 transmembrane protein 268-like [Carassius auratus]
MEERERQCNREERADVESPTGQSVTAGEPGTESTWTNGECVASVSTSTWFTPTFDFSHCRTLLETKGFLIPAEDFESPLGLALDHPSVRRYLLFNSNIFNVIMAPVLYLVLWCAVYSTIHMYLDGSTEGFWVLCVCVSLVSVILTIAINLIFHYSNKEINMNTDVRLVGVNEHMARHKLLLGVADWVQKCRANMQLFCMYWDMSPCLISLTEALDNMGFVRDQVQNRLKKRMSHLVLVTEVTTLAPEAGEQDEELPEEERPLLEGREPSASTSQREDSKLTKNFSLMPDTTLTNKAIARQLLMTYSALYVRLLVSNKLPAPPQRSTRAGKNHSTSCLCLCEYVELKVLR